MYVMQNRDGVGTVVLGLVAAKLWYVFTLAGPGLHKTVSRAADKGCTQGRCRGRAAQGPLHTLNVKVPGGHDRDSDAHTLPKSSVPTSPRIRLLHRQLVNP